MNKTVILGSLLLAFSLFSCKEKNNTEKVKTPQVSVENTKKVKPTLEVHHYICYTNDKKKSQQIWISFDKKNEAIQIKYKGQTAAIPLVFEKEEMMNDGAHPTVIKFYNEIYNGQINGIYKLTHSGIWDYVEYTRGTDQKKFNFTIDHSQNPYGKNPCF